MNKQSNLKSLLLASLSGRFVYALASMASLPLLSRLLGAEAVGLVGFFSTIVMVMMVFEGGLTSNVIQQLARRKGRENRAHLRHSVSSGSLIATYLCFFAAVGVVLTGLITVLSDYLVGRWLSFSALEFHDVKYSLICMGLFVGLNLPVLILQSAFVGREQQEKLNCLYIPYSLARTLGVLMLMLIVPEWRNIQSYFLIQVLIQAVYVLSLLFSITMEFRRVLKFISPRFLYLKNGWAFSRGVLLISLTSVFVVQYDKLYLSGHVGLSDYAAYALASTLAGLPYIFSSALNSVLFPRFSVNLSSGDEGKIASVFRIACSVITFLMVVLCSSVYYFGDKPISMLFSPELASGIAPLLPVLLVGTALQSILIVPFALQLAARWTHISLWLNLVWIPVALLLMPFMVAKFGVMGGAYIWLIYNIYSIVLTFFIFAKKFSFMRQVNSELLRFAFISTLVFMLFCVSVQWVAMSISNPYMALSFEVACVLAVVAVVAYVFRRNLMQFR